MTPDNVHYHARIPYRRRRRRRRRVSLSRRYCCDTRGKKKGAERLILLLLCVLLVFFFFSLKKRITRTLFAFARALGVTIKKKVIKINNREYNDNSICFFFFLSPRVRPPQPRFAERFFFQFSRTLIAGVTASSLFYRCRRCSGLMLTVRGFTLSVQRINRRIAV